MFVLNKQPTAIRCPSSQDSPHKRDIDDIQTDQPTSKKPRQLSPSHNTPSNLESQPQSPPPNEEDFDPPPTLANDEKRQQQQQQDDTRDNKKQKQQENAIQLTITETPLPQLITLSDPVPTPTDPLLETLAMPTPPQIVVPQPLITESTTNETTVNYPNQEQTTTTHGFKHHSLLTTEPSPETSPQEPKTTTKLLSEVATIEPPPDNPNHDLDTTEESVMPKPLDWNTYSKSKKANWRNRHGKRQTTN